MMGSDVILQGRMLPEEFSTRLIVFDDRCGNGEKTALFAELAATMAQSLAPARAGEILRSAEDREQLAPTWIGCGMAVPHARVSGLKVGGVLALRCPDGIVWTPEGDRATLIFFLTVPDESPELHLHLLSVLVRWRRSLHISEQQLLALPHCEFEAGLRAALYGDGPNLVAPAAESRGVADDAERRCSGEASA